MAEKTMLEKLKEGVKEAIQLCKEAGIKSIMITGDHPLTAQAIAHQIGLKDAQAVTGMEIEKMSEKHMQTVVREHSIFARASSAHKVKILKALQANGDIVAMTGDGINDAPALKNANVGVAMSLKGTDVSRDAADMVLTDDHYASIVAAIEQGRIVYDNIKRFVNYLLSANAAEVGVILVALLFGLPLPLLPIHILWINLMTDSWPALALGAEKGSKDIMKRKPRDPKENFMKGLKGIIVITGIVGTLVTLGIFQWELMQGSSYMKATTMALTTLIIFEVLRAYSCKSRRPFTNLLTNKWLHIAVLVSIILQLAILYTPLNVAFKVEPLALADWGKILVLAFVGYILLEISKLFGKRS